MGIKNFALAYSPAWLGSFFITVYNTFQYRMRHGGSYKKWREYYALADTYTESELLAEAQRRKTEFLNFVVSNSSWYKGNEPTRLESFPVLEKFQLIEHLDKIITLKSEKGYVSLTGGTTGASMKVVYTYEDMQERFAILDHFREKYGYSLKRKVAWFSGKDFVRPRDVEKGRFYRDDWINKIRFFSTFNINKRNFSAYWKSLNEFQPEFIVGFPSSVLDLCQIAKGLNLKYTGKVKFFFPTAETVLPIHREIIKEVLGCDLVNQYASSEGAPFILECPYGSLHMQTLTGIFEVVDQNLEPVTEGEMLVTAFGTRGTPLVRYKIGDRVKLAQQGFKCKCGSHEPVVEYIDGRPSDYVFSPENGRVNLGNISNCTKDADGIICFQIIQELESAIAVSIVVNDRFDIKQKNNFIAALRARLGNGMDINVKIVDDIPKERSGKFRIVKNRLAK